MVKRNTDVYRSFSSSCKTGDSSSPHHQLRQNVQGSVVMSTSCKINNEF